MTSIRSSVALEYSIKDRGYYFKLYNKPLKKRFHFLVIRMKTKERILIGNDIEFYDKFMIVKNNTKSCSIKYSDLACSEYKIEVI